MIKLVRAALANGLQIFTRPEGVLMYRDFTGEPECQLGIGFSPGKNQQ